MRRLGSAIAKPSKKIEMTILPKHEGNYVKPAIDWTYSSFHRWVKRNVYAEFLANNLGSGVDYVLGFAKALPSLL